MAFQEVTMYRLVCDADGCKASAQDASEYYAWAEHEGCESEAEAYDWHQTADGKWLCQEHAPVCSSCGEPAGLLAEPDGAGGHRCEGCPPIDRQETAS